MTAEDLGYSLQHAQRWVESYDKAIEKAEAEARASIDTPRHEVDLAFVETLKEGRQFALKQVEFAQKAGRP